MICWLSKFPVTASLHYTLVVEIALLLDRGLNCVFACAVHRVEIIEFCRQTKLLFPQLLHRSNST